MEQPFKSFKTFNRFAQFKSLNRGFQTFQGFQMFQRSRTGSVQSFQMFGVPCDFSHLGSLKRLEPTNVVLLLRGGSCQLPISLSSPTPESDCPACPSRRCCARARRFRTGSRAARTYTLTVTSLPLEIIQSLIARTGQTWAKRDAGKRVGQRVGRSTGQVGQRVKSGV